MKTNQLAVLLGLTGTVLLGCSSDDNDNNASDPALQPIELAVFDDDGKLEAQIRRTTYGVPHITADNLESVAFGSGYAQAEDHLCLIADGVIKGNSQRSMYFGPHTLDFTTMLPKAEDNKNLISDFGYLALRVRESAEATVPNMPDRSRAMLSGFTKGYNQYLEDLPGSQTPNLPCAGQPWVQPIDEVDLMTYLFSVAHMAGTGNFLDLMFFANPGDGNEYLPRPAAMASVSVEGEQLLAQIDATARQQAQELGIPTLNEGGAEVGSNGWGLGKDVTENGKGIVLGNPHFPHTGELRFWQSHLTIPGQLDVMGGSLVGMPGAINIGFNQNLAWTHTYSTAEHFVMYRLSLKDGDRMTYLFDGEEMPIEKRIATIQVNVGGGAIIPLEKEIYLTPKGPMVEAPPELAPFGWTDGNAFFVQDANDTNVDVLEHWMSMNLARNLDEFQQAFKDYDGVIFNNTMYADDQGNTFYIDDSTVPNLGITAMTALTTDPTLKGLKEQAGFTLLPGDSSLFAFDDAVPYEQAPKLQRDDFVQNSNNSYWSTNPADPIEGVSPLYGLQRSELTLRTRLGLTLMEDARGDDGLFNPTEVEQALMSNRAYLAELVLPELLAQCEAQGDTPVVLSPELSYDLTPACAALAKWNGSQNLDSPAGALLREFGYRFSSDMLEVPFDYTQPVTTPHTLANDGLALQALAAAAASLTANGFELDAPLGSMQFVEKSLPDGTASGARFPWSGANNKEGGFNVFGYSSRDTTLLPHHAYPKAMDPVTGKAMSSGLSTEGYHVRSGSSWMMVVGFTEDGPVARGLLSYSESNNALSPQWNDQTQFYSENTALRPLLFDEAAIVAGLQSELNLSVETGEQ